MDQRTITDLNNNLRLLFKSNLWGRGTILGNISTCLIKAIGNDYFSVNINDTYKVKRSNTEYSESLNHSNKIYLARNVYNKGSVCDILYEIVHESVHKAQDIADKWMKESKNSQIQALYLNNQTLILKTCNNPVNVKCYFPPPLNNIYGAFVETGELCYKLQPREFQAREITFRVLKELWHSPQVDPDIKQEIYKATKKYGNEHPFVLRESGFKLHGDIDIANEINHLISNLNGEHQYFIDSRIIRTFVKTQTSSAGIDMSVDNTLESFNISTSTNWDELCVSNNYTLDIESKPSQDLSLKELKVLDTLATSKFSLEDYNEHER